MELSVIEDEFVRLAEEIVEVRPGECLACYLDRLLPQVGCRGFALSERWNAAQKRPAKGLQSWLERNGGYCDCEVVFNVFGRGRRSARHRRLQCEESFSRVLE